MKNYKIEKATKEEMSEHLFSKEIGYYTNPKIIELDKPGGCIRIFDIEDKEIKTGSFTGYKDAMGNQIFENHQLVELEKGRPVAEVSSMCLDDYIDFGLSNYHCSHCPIISTNVVIVGVIDRDDGDQVYYCRKKDKE